MRARKQESTQPLLIGYISKLGISSRVLLSGKRAPPAKQLLSKMFCNLRVIFGQVPRFRAVGDEIVKFSAAAVSVGEQFPHTIADGEIGTAIATGRIAERFVVAAVFPK